MKAVSDSTVLIGLAKIEKTDLLRDLFQKIYIPEAVFREVTEQGDQRAGAKIVREAGWIITVCWVSCLNPTYKDYEKARYATDIRKG
jgi:predicted nucleic acid-binding protein